MTRPIFILFCIFQSLNIFGQGEVLDIQVTKEQSKNKEKSPIIIRSDIPYYVYWGTFYANPSGHSLGDSATTAAIMANLSNGFSCSNKSLADSTCVKYTAIKLIVYTQNRSWRIDGNKLSEEMINAIKSEPEGCKFSVELFREKAVAEAVLYFDTRPKYYMDKSGFRRLSK